MDYISVHGRGASDGGVFGLAAPPFSATNGSSGMPMPLRALSAAFAAWRWEIPATPEASVRESWKCASTMGGIPDLLCASRSTDRDPVVWRRQAHATAGHQTGSETGGDIVMTRTARFDAADYLDTEER